MPEEVRQQVIETLVGARGHQRETKASEARLEGKISSLEAAQIRLSL